LKGCPELARRSRRRAGSGFSFHRPDTVRNVKERLLAASVQQGSRHAHDVSIAAGAAVAATRSAITVTTTFSETTIRHLPQ